MFKLLAVLMMFLLAVSAGVAADQPVTDEAIIDLVRVRLASDAEVKGGALMVDAKNGVVTLTGSVDSDKLKNKATKLAKKVKGVKQVVNNLTLKEKTAGR
jgi:hyperosmotically inducible periplasmic protein